VVTLASVFLLSTAVGVTLGGVGSLVSKAVESNGARLNLSSANLNPARMKQKANQVAQDVRNKAEQATGGNLEQQARETGQTATRNLSAASFGAFIALLLGALAGGLGGIAGAPRSLIVGPYVRSNSSREA